jgi:hypothetical protein
MHSIKGLGIYLLMALAQIAFCQSALATPQFTGPSAGSEFNPMEAEALPNGYQVWRNNTAPLADQSGGVGYYSAASIFVSETEDLPSHSSNTASMPELSMATPDPSTIALVGLGLIVLGMARRKRNKKRNEDRKAG